MDISGYFSVAVSLESSPHVSTAGFLQVKHKSGYIIFLLFSFVVVARYLAQYFFFMLCTSKIIQLR